MQLKSCQKNPKFYKRSKHLNIMHYFNRKVLKAKQAELYHVNIKKQITDILIKPVERSILNYSS